MDTTIPTTDTSIEQPVRTYLRRLSLLVFSPGRFYREEFPSLSLSDALTFGVVSGWIAAGIAFCVETLNSLLLVSLFERWVQKIFASEEGFSFLGLSGDSFLWSAGLLMIAPFLFLFRLALSSMTLYVFGRLFIDDESEPVTYRSMLALRATAFGGQWFSVIPFFGTFLAFIANLALLVSGIRERYRVSTRRAVAVVLAPYVLLLAFGFLLFLLTVFAIMQIPFQEMFDLGSPRDLGGF